MRVPYCHHHRDFAGRIWLPDLECELECSISEAPDFEVSVDAVWVDLYPTGRVDLIGREATPEMRLIGMQIVEDAERDDDVVAKARDQAGIVYVGLGSNDPDGRLVRAV